MKTITRRPNPSAKLDQFPDLHPMLARIFASRGIESSQELDTELASLLPYHQLLNIELASERLSQAIMQQERILIVGDFDADGATSTSVAVSVLRSFGAKHVDFLVPNRFEYGYGLTPEIVAVAHELKRPDLIVTVDNGISSITGVDAANALGIDVLITDHHLPAEELPKAVAIVNPNQKGCPFPSKNLAGVGVIFYVMCAVRRTLQQHSWFSSQNIPEPNMGASLDLVALGTVADVVPLDQNNRILVKQGVDRIRAGKCRPGITALLQIAKRDPKQIVASDLGFVVGPRLNAAGRLDDMSLGILCLLSESLTQAIPRATELDELNHERRNIEADMQSQAKKALEKLHLDDRLPIALCLYDETWHQGVIGIVAGRIKDQHHRPTIAFAKVSDAEIKGSARSVTGVHIRDALEAVATQNPGLINKFGGHAMAAGLSLAPDKFELFKQVFEAEVSRHLSHDDVVGKIVSDGELEPELLNLEFAELLRMAGPFGQEFPEPCFDGEFELLEQRIVGMKHLRVVLQSSDNPTAITGIAFNIDLQQWPNHRCRRVHIAYRLDVNEYRGQRSPQFMIEQISPVT